MTRSRKAIRIRILAWTAISMGALNTGCQVSDSLADGFYGGISGVVSTLISDTILGLLQAGGS